MQTLSSTLPRFQVPPPDVIARSAEAARQEEQRLQSDQRRRRYSAARIPERFRDAELCHCTPDIGEWVDASLRGSGQDLLLIGKPGRGKTYAACAAANAILKHTRCRFATHGEMLDEVKATFDTYGESEHDATAHFTVQEFLVVDDLGEAPPTEWNLSKTFRILDKRYSEKRPTIYTTMYEPVELVKRLTSPDDVMRRQAILSRFMQAKQVLFNGDDRRLA